MENAKLDAWQIFTLTFCFTIGTTFILLPGGLISMAKQFAWTVQLWACLYGLLLASIWLFLYKLHPGLNVVQIAVNVLGKRFGGLVAILYIVYFVQITSWVTRNMSDYMHSNIMPRTPISVFNIVVLFECAYAAVKGIECIATASGIMTPILIFLYWIPFTIMLKEWDWSRFIMNHDIHFGKIFVDTKYALGFPFMETISLMMLFPYVQAGKLRKPYFAALSAAGLLLAVSIFFTIGVLGVYRSSHLTYPLYTIFREMQLSNFAEHLEAIISVNVLVMVFLKGSICFYCAVLAICHLSGLQSRAAVAYPLIWVVSAYAMLFSNVIENIDWVEKYLFTYYTLYAILLPSLLIAVTWARQGKMKPRES